MKKIFLIHTENFHLEIVPRLSRLGLSVSLVCSSGSKSVESYRSLLPSAVVLSTFDIMGGRLPMQLSADIKPVCGQKIEALAACEGTALLMIDRLNYFRESLIQVRALYIRYISVWTHLLERFRPDAVVFQSVPHMGYDFVLYHLCKNYGIQTLIVDRTYLNDRLMLLSDIEEIPGPDPSELLTAKSRNPEASKKRAEGGGYLDVMNKQYNNIRDLKRRLSYQFLARTILNRAILRQARNRVVSSVNGLAQKQPREITFKLYELREHLKAKKALAFYERFSVEPDLNAEFIYCPLHFQPERSTLPGGGFLSDQLHNIEILSAALPAGWKIYVKEHPRQFRRGILWSKARNLEFYECLSSNPRVVLVPLDTPSADLIAKSRAVCTITGTSGWEALHAGKPVLVFGYPWYLKCPGVVKVHGVDDCAQALSKIRDGELAVIQTLVESYTATLEEKYTFKGAFSDELLDLSVMSGAENADSYARVIYDAIYTPKESFVLI